MFYAGIAAALFFLWWLARGGPVAPLLLGEALIAMVWAALKNHSPTPAKIIMATPLIFLFSLMGLMIIYPRPEEAGKVSFWRPRPGGVGVDWPNADHPMASYVKLFWAVLLAIWIGAWDEALRRDFSRFATRIGGF